MRVRFEPGEQELYRSPLTPFGASLFRSIPRVVLVTNQRIITYLDDNGAINDISWVWLKDIRHLSCHQAANILGMQYWIDVGSESYFLKKREQRDQLAAVIERSVDQLP